MTTAIQHALVEPSIQGHTGTGLYTALPTADEYCTLREAAGWPPSSQSAAAAGLAASSYTVSIREAGELIGFGRLVGDGVTAFYVQDLLVLPSRKGQGVERRIMTSLLGYIKAHGCAGATVGVLAPADAEGFYESYGFVGRPNVFLGAGMSMTLPYAAG